MSVNALLEEFKVKAATPKQQLAEYKAQGKKVVGVLPYYAPEELVYAAGIVPMGMWGSNTKTISRAKEYCATFYCTIAQLALEMLLDGTMDQLDGIITPTICDTLRPMSQNFRVAMGDKMKVIFLAHPQTVSKSLVFSSVSISTTMLKLIWKKSLEERLLILTSRMLSLYTTRAVQLAVSS